MVDDCAYLRQMRNYTGSRTEREKRGDLETTLAKQIKDKLKFSSVSTGNIMKEGITVIKSTTNKSYAILLRLRETYIGKCGEDRRYDRN